MSIFIVNACKVLCINESAILDIFFGVRIIYAVRTNLSMFNSWRIVISNIADNTCSKTKMKDGVLNFNFYLLIFFFVITESVSEQLELLKAEVNRLKTEKGNLMKQQVVSIYSTVMKSCPPIFYYQKNDKGSVIKMFKVLWVRRS